MAGEAHSAHAAGEHGSAGFPPFDASLFSHQIFWFAIAFGLLYILLASVILPRITATIEARRQRISEDLAAAAAQTEAAQAAWADAEQASARSRAAARETVESMRRDTDARIAAADTEAQAAAETRIKAAEAQVATARAEALAGIGGTVRELAEDIVERLSGAKPTAAQIKAVFGAGGA